MTPNGGLCTQLTASQANWETERKPVGKGEFKESVMSVNEASELRDSRPSHPCGTQSLQRHETVSFPSSLSSSESESAVLPLGGLDFVSDLCKPTVAVLTAISQLLRDKHACVKRQIWWCSPLIKTGFALGVQPQSLQELRNEAASRRAFTPHTARTATFS